MEIFNKKIMQELQGNNSDVYGKKRQCGNCLAKFFDLNRVDFDCPSCGTKFDPDFFNKMKKIKKTSASKDSTKEKIKAAVFEEEEEDFFLSDINK